MPDQTPFEPGTTRRTAIVAGGMGVSGLALSGCGSDDTGLSVPTADVPEGGGTILKDAKIVVTQPSAGQFKAFSAVCTHQGCVVSAVTDTIDCACHNSKFALADGAVVSGPATSPLPAKTVTADGDNLVVS